MSTVEHKAVRSAIIAVFGVVISAAMLPVANLHLKELYDSTIEFISSYSPAYFPFRAQQPTEFPSGTSSARTLTPDPLPIRTRTRERGPLRERLDEVCGASHSTCSCPPSASSCLSAPSMRRELDVTKNELARSQLEVAKLHERCKMLERTLRETKELLQTRDAEVEKMRRDKEKERVAESRRRSGESQHQNIHSRHTSVESRTSGDTNRRVGSEEELSRPDTQEERARLRSTEMYMTRTDSWSGAQVLQAVHDLNSEILQFAASATELCTFDKDSRPSSSRSIQAMHDTSSRVGPNLARILSSRDHSQDPILVQLALQGCISTCISRAVSAFCIGYPSKSDAILTQIYSHMSLAEPQPTSSKWRALAHRHIHMIYPTLADYAINDLCETIFRWTADIFIIAGCSSYDTAISSSRDNLRVRFGDQVRRISKSVTRLARVTREEIMSTNFDVIAVDPGDAFDSHIMSDAFRDYGPSRGFILATTELGLKCTTRKGASEAVKEEVTVEQRILLQPKVVLESVLDVLDPR